MVTKIFIQALSAAKNEDNAEYPFKGDLKAVELKKLKDGKTVRLENVAGFKSAIPIPTDQEVLVLANVSAYSVDGKTGLSIAILERLDGQQPPKKA